MKKMKAGHLSFHRVCHLYVFFCFVLFAKQTLPDLAQELLEILLFHLHLPTGTHWDGRLHCCYTGVYVGSGI